MPEISLDQLRARATHNLAATLGIELRELTPKRVIATMPVKGMRPDILDDHYYKREQGMFQEAKHYDNADRKGPKIFQCILTAQDNAAGILRTLSIVTIAPFYLCCRK